MNDRRRLEVGVGTEQFTPTDGHVEVYVQAPSGEDGQLEIVGQVSVDLQGLRSGVSITVSRVDESWFGSVNLEVV